MSSGYVIALLMLMNGQQVWALATYEDKATCELGLADIREKQEWVVLDDPPPCSRAAPTPSDKEQTE